MFNVQGFTAKHWTALGLLLAAVGQQVGSLTNWGDALRPSFVSGVFTAIAAVLVAINSSKPSGDTPSGGAGFVTPRVAMWLVAAMLPLSLVSCAGHISPKKLPTLTSQAIHTALADAHDAERIVYQSHAVPALTDAKQVEIDKLFVKAFTDEKAVSLAIQQLTAGQPAPSSIAALLADTNAVLTAIISLGPSSATSSALQAVQVVIRQAQALAALFIPVDPTEAVIELRPAVYLGPPVVVRQCLNPLPLVCR